MLNLLLFVESPLSLPLSFSLSLSLPLGFGTRNIGNAGGKFDTWTPRASNWRGFVSGLWSTPRLRLTRYACWFGNAILLAWFKENFNSRFTRRVTFSYVSVVRFVKGKLGQHGLLVSPLFWSREISMFGTIIASSALLIFSRFLFQMEVRYLRPIMGGRRFRLE